MSTMVTIAKGNTIHPYSLLLSPEAPAEHRSGRKATAVVVAFKEAVWPDNIHLLQKEIK